MNRVIVGIITVAVIAGIVLLAVRAFQSLNLGGAFKQDVPRSGKLVLPSSQAVGFTSPPPLSSPALITPPGSITGVSPKPSPASVSPSANKLPATGF